jgi:hypothetical protein
MHENPRADALARVLLLIRGAMGAPRNRKRWLLGALAATVGALWIAACDESGTGTPSPGAHCLNPQPLPPENCEESPTPSSSGSGGEGSSSGGSSSGQTAGSNDAGVFDAAPPPQEADASADAAPEDGSGDAAADADADANACTVHSSEIACCCDGDVGGNGPFCSGGSLNCATGFGLYFGADCTRECGPCAVPCPESGTSGGGADASHD